jgi:aryl-alcohol dehydrogenase-like predicted oxidoreductase
MQYVNLGRSGIKVSRLCLGTMNFGPYTSEEDSFAIMDKALELGINFFDTANVYGAVIPGVAKGPATAWDKIASKVGVGETEQIIGRWLAQGNRRREQIVLATKVNGRMGEGPNDRRLSAYHIRKACEDSLRRLQTDHIDLYQMHHVDRETPWEETWQAMQVLVQQGKVIYVGSSNFAGLHIALAQQAAKERHFMGLISEQSHYNLNARMIELEVIPAIRAFGLGLIPWSPLAGGLLGGILQKQKEGRRATESVEQKISKHRPQLEAYENLCREIGEPPADVAMAWLLHNPVVTSPIIGPRTPQQLESSLHSLDVHLSVDVIVKIENIWPGPGGEAPEAYAW